MGPVAAADGVSDAAPEAGPARASGGRMCCSSIDVQACPVAALPAYQRGRRARTMIARPMRMIRSGPTGMSIP